MSSNLIAFAGRALEKGLERDEIAQALQAAGWPKDKVAAALDAYADGDFGLPIPKPRAYVSARATFTHLLLFSSLYICIWAFLSLIFSLIDRFLPDPLVEGWADYSTTSGRVATIRTAISVLVVFFTLFAFMFRLTNRNRVDPDLRSSTVRRWFVYLTLFVAAVTIAGCVATLVYVFLSGELSSRFLLKILTDAIVAGGILAYFLQDVRQDQDEQVSGGAMSRASLGFLTASSVLVVAAVALGVFVTPLPSNARLIAHDEKRIEDLAAIARAILGYQRANGRLPSSLRELPEAASLELSDRATGTAYGYIVDENRKFHLCSDFATVSTEARRMYKSPPEASGWRHQSGHVCFAFPAPSNSPERQEQE